MLALALAWFAAVTLLHAQGAPAAPRTGTPLRIAAASDLQPVLPTLAAAFERQTGTHIEASFGSSATLAQQIGNGLPVDVFLSADCTHPQQIADAGLGAAPSPVPYATGVLVLWARKDSPAQPVSLQSLTGPRVTHVAVANDRHAPYGQAAMAELRALKLSDALAEKLVRGENIMQTAQLADSGNAQAAFLSLTIASSPHFHENGSFVRLPALYPPIRQCGLPLKRADRPREAAAFLRWLTSAQTQHRLHDFGLEPAQP